MHTTSGPEGTNFHHNGDYSGPVHFTATTSAGISEDVAVPFHVLAAAIAQQPDADQVTITAHGAGGSASSPYGSDVHVVDVPGRDLRHLIALRTLSERVSDVEAMGIDELFAAAAADELARWSRDPDANGSEAVGSVFSAVATCVRDLWNGLDYEDSRTDTTVTTTVVAVTTTLTDAEAALTDWLRTQPGDASTDSSGTMTRWHLSITEADPASGQITSTHHYHPVTEIRLVTLA